MILNIESKIADLKNTPSDINEHFDTIIEYGKLCNHITEMGVRSIVSTWGWLYAKPQKLVAYDIKHPSEFNSSLEDIGDTAKSIGVDFSFYCEDVLKIQIEETDLLFIDTLHSYDQLRKELFLHGSKVKKYICFHDTTSFESVNETYGDFNNQNCIKHGIWPAIEEFLEDNKNWVLDKRFFHNNGFTIIKRLS
jgi:hypothetical protein